jgi:hypothetical protein
MTASNPPNDGAKPKRPLPPELAFLTERPNRKEMEAEEYIAWAQNHHVLIRKHAALIRQHGMDPDKLIAFTEPTLRALEQAQADYEKAQQEMFHRLADKADAERDLFQAADALVKAAAEEHPFDENVQEFKEFVDEWRKQMPKE